MLDMPESCSCGHAGADHHSKGSRSADKKKQKPAARIQPAEQGVVDHFRPVDTSGVEVEGDTLKDCVLWYINSGSITAADRETLVARLGGRVSSAIALSDEL